MPYVWKSIHCTVHKLRRQLMVNTSKIIYDAEQTADRIIVLSVQRECAVNILVSNNFLKWIL